MNISIPEGISLASHYTVQAEHLDTAQKGKIGILTTLAVLQFMENTCVALVEGYLPASHTLLSVEMNVKHIAAVKQGAQLICNAALKYIDEENLYFDVAVLDEEQNEVALGAQEYMIVNVKEFITSL